MASSRRFQPLFTGHSESVPEATERRTLNQALRDAEMKRLRRSKYGEFDLALVRALGLQFRYLRRDQAELFFPGLSSEAIGRRLGHLWRAQWINRESQAGTGLKHPPQVYTIGELGADWLRRSLRTPPRWPVRAQWAGELDVRQPHWLGIADVWAQLVRFTQEVPGLRLAQFDTELDYKWRRGDGWTSFKPDFIFQLVWGPTIDDVLVGIGEFDRGTEPLTRWQVNKIENARHFAGSDKWPFPNGRVDYWVFAPDVQRLEGIAGPKRHNLILGPFGSYSGWVLVPWEAWLETGMWSMRQWMMHHPQSAAEGNRWNAFAAFVAHNRTGRQ